MSCFYILYQDNQGNSHMSSGHSQHSTQSRTPSELNEIQDLVPPLSNIRNNQESTTGMGRSRSSSAPVVSTHSSNNQTSGDGEVSNEVVLTNDNEPSDTGNNGGGGGTMGALWGRMRTPRSSQTTPRAGSASRGSSGGRPGSSSGGSGSSGSNGEMAAMVLEKDGEINKLRKVVAVGQKEVTKLTLQVNKLKTENKKLRGNTPPHMSGGGKRHSTADHQESSSHDQSKRGRSESPVDINLSKSEVRTESPDTATAVEGDTTGTAGTAGGTGSATGGSGDGSDVEKVKDDKDDDSSKDIKKEDSKEKKETDSSSATTDTTTDNAPTTTTPVTSPDVIKPDDGVSVVHIAGFGSELKEDKSKGDRCISGENDVQYSTDNDFDIDGGKDDDELSDVSVCPCIREEREI